MVFPSSSVIAESDAAITSEGYIGWEEGLITSGASSEVNALLYHDGILYAGGDFNYMDDVAVNKIAMWDFSNPGWASLGQGVTEGGTDFNDVQDMAVDSNGNLIVVGNFVKMDGVTVNNVAVWDGSSWSAFGAGIPGGQVYAVAVDSADHVYVGGQFSTAGSVSVMNIARWNATSMQWEPLNNGLNATVLDLEYNPDQDLVYAAGRFTQTAGSPSYTLNHVGSWKESGGWSPLFYNSAFGADDHVYTLAYDSGDQELLVGGAFNSFMSIPAHHCAVLDASSGIPSAECDTDGPVYAFAKDTATGNIYVGGEFTQLGAVSASNIGVWQPTPSFAGLDAGTDKQVNAIVVMPGNARGATQIVAAGKFTVAGASPSDQLPENYMALWTTGGSGDQWSALSTLSISDPMGINGTVYDIAVDAFGRTTYVGDFSSIAGKPYHNIYDGIGSVSEGGGSDGAIYTVSHGEDGDLYIGGAFTEVEGVSASYLAHWDSDSDTWAPLGGVFPNDDVESIYVDGSNVYIGGKFTQIGPNFYNHVAMWDTVTETWHSLGNGLSMSLIFWTPSVNDLLMVDGTLYATGVFNISGATYVDYIAAWDGTAWSSVGSGLDFYGQTLAADSNHNLYVGGAFTTAGGVAAENLAMWDGVSWHAVGTGFGGTAFSYVSALAFDEAGQLIVSGDFTLANGEAANYIVLYDGSGWRPLGSGLSARAEALAFTPSGDLIAGGWFDRAGSGPSSHIAFNLWGSAFYLPLILQ